MRPPLHVSKCSLASPVFERVFINFGPKQINCPPGRRPENSWQIGICSTAVGTFLSLYTPISGCAVARNILASENHNSSFRTSIHLLDQTHSNAHFHRFKVITSCICSYAYVMLLWEPWESLLRTRHFMIYDFLSGGRKNSGCSDMLRSGKSHLNSFLAYYTPPPLWIKVCEGRHSKIVGSFSLVWTNFVWKQ